MNEKELLTRKFILVGMGEAEISTNEKPIIGTQALATCIGVLLYSEDKKIAIVAHVPPDEVQAMMTIDKIFQLIIDNKLIHTNFKYKIIKGYYDEHYNIKGLLEKHFSHFTPFGENAITEQEIQTDETLESRQFAFDALTGKFVTDKVYFGLEYIAVNTPKRNHR